MQLPSLFGHSNSSSDHFFLSMFIADGVLQAGLWVVDQNQITILSQSGVYQYETSEAAISQADLAFSELGPESEKAKKIVFGFEPSWIDQNGMHASQKDFLKKLTADLALEPVGFVSLTESVLQQFLSVDALLNAVVMIFNAKQVWGFLVKQGKILTQVDVARSEDLLLDTKAVIAKLARTAKSAEDYLPVQINIVATGNAEADVLAQQHLLINYPWLPEFSFVAPPKFEIAPASFVIEAVTNQGGIAVAKARGLLVAQSNVVARTLDGKVEKNQDLGQETELETTKSNAADFLDQPNQNQALSFGVPIIQSNNEILDQVPEVDPDYVAPVSFDPNSFVAFAHSKHPVTVRKIVVFSVLAGLVTVILVGFLTLWMLFKVKISIQPTLITLTKDIRITLDPKAAATDSEKLILKANLTKKDLSGSATTATTGIKLVGDKATGVIKIFNKTGSVKVFAKGTELSSGTIKFILQDEAKVASASVIQNGAESETRDYGELETKVSAVDIGADANLAKEAPLKIASFDTLTYTAMVKDGLTGGSSREVRVVAAEDKAKLQKTLMADLTTKAEAAFKVESKDGKYLTPTNRTIQVVPKFDAEVGKEAETLALDMMVSFEGLQYTREDLKPIIVKVLGSDLKPGYVLPDSDPQFISQPESNASGSGKIILDVNLAIESEPVISVTEISQQVAGLTLNQTETKLKSLTFIKQHQIDFSPVLARWLVGRMPRDINKITTSVIKKK